MKQLHFGTKWGFAVQVPWAILGVSLPLLTVTGALTYRSVPRLDIDSYGRRVPCTAPSNSEFAFIPPH
jgi:hypothetical protein